MRGRFEKAAAELAAKLRGIDIDRIFLDASLAEIQRIGRATEGLPFEGHVPFATTTRIFKTYVKTVRQKALRLKAAKNEFVKANLRLVVSIARRFNHGRLPLADLIQEGNIGLMKAVERYDYRRGFRFSTYASWWIRHAISRALADKGRAVRLPVHMIDAYHRIAKSQRELQSKLERPPTTEEIAAATGIEAEKLEKMRTFLSETPVSLDRPISDEDGRRLIDVLVDPNEGPGVPDQMVSTETQSEMLEAARGTEADRGRHPAQAVRAAQRPRAHAQGDRRRVQPVSRARAPAAGAGAGQDASRDGQARDARKNIELDHADCVGLCPAQSVVCFVLLTDLGRRGYGHKPQMGDKVMKRPLGLALGLLLVGFAACTQSADRSRSTPLSRRRAPRPVVRRSPSSVVDSSPARPRRR